MYANQRKCPECGDIITYKEIDWCRKAELEHRVCKRCAIKIAKKFNSGFVRGQIPWNKGLTKDTNDAIYKMSLARIGDNNPCMKAIKNGKYTPWLSGKTYEQIYGAAAATALKDRIRKSVCEQYKNGRTKGVNTKPELLFKSLMENNDIKFEQTYYLKNKFYDFYIPDKNILIEIDGIYWHGRGYDKNELNETQIKNRANDLVKNKIAEQNGYKLIRIWEDEINKFDFKKLK